MTDYLKYTDEQINHLIANRIMGWTISDVEDDWGLCWMTDMAGYHIMDERLWNPCKDMNQAWEAWRYHKKQYPDDTISINNIAGDEAIVIEIDGDNYACVKHEPFARAICIALLEAEEEK